jgi:trk system potassium uptake protein TrkA
MKFIIIGLGNFGASLAIKLTQLGHEVVGVDLRAEKVEAFKDKMSYTIALDTTNPGCIQHLPIAETDCVIIAIGENEAASIMSTAVMKQTKIKRIISRAVSPLQNTVLEAMGIEEIVHPEEESANKLAYSLDLKGVLDSFAISKAYNIIEAKVPDSMVGNSIAEIDFRRQYNLNVLTILKRKKTTSMLGTTSYTREVTGVVLPETILEADDYLVLFGKITDIRRFLKD